MVLASASAFICATISTSADQASVTTQAIRPSSSNLGAKSRPSSTCSVVARGANVEDFSALATTRLAVRRLPCAAERIPAGSGARAFAGPARASSAGGTAAHQRDEPDLLAGIVAEQPGELGRDGLRARLLDAAQGHAGVLGLEHHRDAARFQHLVDRRDHLRIEMLLRLQTPGINVDQ